MVTKNPGANLVRQYGRERWTAALATTLIILLFGCGDSAVSTDNACTVLAQAQCSRRQVCADTVAGQGATATYPDGVYLLKNYGDMATCLARQKLACVNSVSAPGTGTSPSQVEKCAAEFATWSCVDLFDNGANPPPDCALPGKLANGDVCAFAGQCASRFCSGTKNASCGICANQPIAGTSCATSGCAPGQSCKTESSGDMLCRDRLVVGDVTCTSDTVCDAFSSCVGASTSDPTKSGVCTASSNSVGAVCGGTSPGCMGDLGLTCLGAAGAKTCQTVAYVRAPAACATLADGSRADCVAGDCFTPGAPAAASDTNATCLAKVQDGAACDTQTGPLCLLPARCVIPAGGTTTGTCVVPLASLCN